MNMAQSPAAPTAPNAPVTPRPLIGASIPSDADSYIEDLADTQTLEQLKESHRIAPSTYKVLAMEKVQGEVDAAVRALTLAQAAQQEESGLTIAERKPVELRNSVDELNKILGSGAAPMQQPQRQTQMAAQGGIIGYANGGMNDQPEMDQDSFIAEYGQEAFDLVDEYPEAANILGLGVSASTARGIMAAQPIITGAVLKDPRKVVRALSALKDVKLKDIQNFGTKALDRLRTLRTPKKGDKGKTREERGSEEKFDAERARLEAERRTSGPQTVKDFPDTAKPRSDVEVGASGPSQTVLKGGERVPKGQELAPRTTQSDAVKSGIMSRIKDKLPSPKTVLKTGAGTGILGALGYGLYDKLTDDFSTEGRPKYEKPTSPKTVLTGTNAGNTPPPFEVINKQLSTEDKDYITKGRELAPTAEDILGSSRFDQTKKEMDIDVQQVGVDAAKDYLNRLGRDEKLEKVNEIFARYKESFDELYSDKKLSRQRRMAAFSNATGNSVGQVLANMQKGFLATENAQDVIIEAHLNKVAGNELYALELDMNMFDKGEERAMAAQTIAAADRRKAKEIMAGASKAEKQGWIEYANALRQKDDKRIDRWIGMVEQFAADYRSMDARDLAEVTAANQFLAAQNALRSAGMATYLSTMDEYKDLMTTLQKALSEGFALTKTEQERLAGLKERARIMVDFQIDPEDRAKEEIAQATVDRYNQQKRLGATERALSVLGAK
jgi:hypothetical protein